MNLLRRIAAALIAAFILTLSAPALAESPADYDMNAPQALSPGHLYAQSALLIDMDTGETLLSKNARVRMYPASTTKIMTLLLALESGIPLDARVTIPVEAGDIPEGSSVVPVKPGDVMSFGDLLYGFMLSSGNDGANAVAVLVDGGIPAFVKHMNERAKALGLEGTHYVNAHGYHTSEHYTTAQDLATLSRFAMQNADFRSIVAAPKWNMTIDRGGKTVNTEIISRNSLLQSDLKYYYPDCTGIKTGHHNKAGWCFVGSAERDGMRVICVTLNCEQENDKWYDAARMFEYGFTRYQDARLGDLMEMTMSGLEPVSVAGADPADPQGGRLALALSNVQGGEQVVKLVSGSEFALNEAVKRVKRGAQVEWQRELTAPISEGETLGRLTVMLDDGLQATADLIASRAVAAEPVATATPLPATAAPMTTEPAQAAPAPERRGGNGAAIAVIALAALLVVLIASAVLLTLRSRRRRSRRRRRRRPGVLR